MHYLHKILVPIDDAIDDERPDRTELIEEVRRYAEEQTERYADAVYDWRETQDAGRWKEIYPRQVYFAGDDLEWFLKELEEVRIYQDSEIMRLRAHLKTLGVNDIETITDKELAAEKRSDTAAICRVFYELACFLNGQYSVDSMFINLSTRSARLHKEDIREIKDNPGNWALVFFDYHD